MSLRRIITEAAAEACIEKLEPLHDRIEREIAGGASFTIRVECAAQKSVVSRRTPGYLAQIAGDIENIGGCRIPEQPSPICGAILQFRRRGR